MSQQLTIRRLDAAVIEGLKSRAASSGHSMEQEARRILEAAVLPSRDGVAARLRRALDERKPSHGGSFSDSALLVRRARSGWSEAQD
jgi:plasmid stability protein